MGRNSRQRREAWRRPDSVPPNPFVRGGEQREPPRAARRDDLAVAEAAVADAVGALLRGSPSADVVRRGVDALIRRTQPMPLALLDDALHAMLSRLVAGAATVGWCPTDLQEFVSRRLGAEHVPRVVDLLLVDARRAPEASAAWMAQIETLGAPLRHGAPTPETLAGALALAALVAGLPDLPVILTRTGTGPVATIPTEPAPVVSGDLGRKLATVRGLLAKAESTTFEEEADALTAKAQELISRYALDRLLEETAGAAGPRAPGIEARRVWLDAPYADAKASLVHAVSQANRCRAVYSTRPGCSTVIGSADDLGSAELLTTSLLVQAARAMMRHGAQVDARGVTRTRSFRATFMHSFAVRIGQRLEESTERAVADHDDADRLLPALIDQDKRVQATFDEMFPATTSRRTRISNGAGWQAGAEAADRAELAGQGRLAAGPPSVPRVSGR